MESLSTQFATPERLTQDQILAQPRPRLSVSQAVLDAIPFIILALNTHRQVVIANRALFTLTGIDENEAVGYRPGELLDCVHAFDSAAGCGTTEFCAMCGVVQAILGGQNGRSETRECRITRRNGSALDLRVWVSPLNLLTGKMTLFTASDISNEKRRQALERIFFHDILNTAGGVRNITELIRRAGPEEASELSGLLHDLAGALIEEIQAQRTLSAAENGELQVELSEIESMGLLQEVLNLYASREIATARQLLIAPASQAAVFKSDRVLLRRVLGNMLKNALEASRPQETISAGCELLDKAIRFWVHNPGVMPREVQLQIFQRSFSTKGSGRGLGTYSIKLITEQYLGGKAQFVSNRDKGTVFSITLPFA